LVWRGAGAWSHAPGRSTAGSSHQSDKSHEPHESDKECGADEFYYDDANDHPGSYQHGDHHPDSYDHGDADHECNDSESERHAVTAALHRGRDC
jgi:hypothetical protein